MDGPATTLVGWYSPPNLRGTLDIVWGFAITVFICTWTANHVNVPPYASPSRWRFLYKLKITMLSLLTPEYTAAVAAVDLRTAVILTNRMRKLGFEKWTLKHSFFVAIGGYMIESEGRYTPLDVDTFLGCLERGQVQIGSAAFKHNTTVTDEVSHSAVEQVEVSVLTEKRETKEISSSPSNDITVLPSITELDIDDRAKADWLLKFISCAQLTWLVIQLIGRAVQGLSLSALEATTISYVSCALFAYSMWWKKPYDLQSPVVVSVAADHPLVAQLRDHTLYVAFDHEPALEIDDRTQIIFIWAQTFIFATYSGLHLLAWDVHFGSLIEQQLWRWMSVSLVALHVVLCTAALMVQSRVSAVKVKKNCIASWHWLADSLIKPITPRPVRPFMHRIHVLDRLDHDVLPPWPTRLALVVLTFYYIWTSVYLLVESFVGLRRMPMLLYMTVNWLQFLPHIH
jgi:hypothetical protein